MNRDPLALVLVTAMVPPCKSSTILTRVEPDPGADDARHVAAAEIALEQAGNVAGRDADAVVLDRDDDDAVPLDGRADLHKTAAGRILDGIGQEVIEHLGGAASGRPPSAGDRR